MLVMRIAVHNETKGTVMEAGKWEPLPDKLADLGELSRYLSKTHGRNSGTVTAEIAGDPVVVGYKFDKKLKDEKGPWVRAAVVVLGDKQGNKVYAFNLRTRSPIRNVSADDLKLDIPVTGYNIGKLPADASPSRESARSKSSRASEFDAVIRRQAETIERQARMIEQLLESRPKAS